MNPTIDRYRARKAYILCDVIAAATPDLRIAAVDVGADLFKNKHNWHHFDPRRLTVHIFDIDSAYNTAGNEIKDMGIESHFYPYAVSDVDGSLTVHHPANAMNGSCFRPNEDMLRLGTYDGQPWSILPVTGEVTLPAMCLDTWKKKYEIGNVDLLKMNIQGAELSALRGGQSVLDDVVAIEIEMSFSQTYVSAPLFSDIDPVLRANNFEFFDLIGPNICSFQHTPVRFNESRNLTSWGFPRHKIFEGHFLYFRDPLTNPKNASLDVAKVLKLAMIAEVYGHVEYAFALIHWLGTNHPTLKTDLAKITRQATITYREAFSR